jgi:hypothetical protein
VVVVALLKLVLREQVEALPVTLELLDRLVLLEQTLVQVAQIQVVVVAQEIQPTLAQLGMAALELLFLNTPTHSQSLLALV